MIARIDAPISIHAPAKGATLHKSFSHALLLYFNPRSREGSDTTDAGQRNSTADFNPRSREGSDGKRTEAALVAFQISIHAPAKGATRQQAHDLETHKNFNPRSREGSDSQFRSATLPKGISIHAPAKGATTTLETTQQIPKFQSTLPRRERQHLLTSFRLQYGYSLFHLTNKI